MITPIHRLPSLRIGERPLDNILVTTNQLAMNDKILVALFKAKYLLVTRAGLRKYVWSSDRTFYLDIESKP